MPRPWGSPRGRQALLLQVVIANVLAPVLLFAMLSDAIDRAAVYGDLDFAPGVASVAGYAFAWVGDFFFEKNRPATFTYPLYSFMGDWVMWRDMLIGRIRF